MQFKIKLGSRVRDQITNFSGRVTGRADYISGCNQYLVVPEATTDGGKYPEAHWFDEQRLLLENADVIALDNSAGNGADAPAPVK